MAGPNIYFDQERDDAVAMLRAVTDRLDALDGALSTSAVDASTVERVLTEIQGGCQACHAVYREQGPGTTDYRLKRSELR